MVQVTDLNAKDPLGYNVKLNDTFQVYAYDKCWRNKLTLTPSQNDYQYVMLQAGSTPAYSFSAI